MSARGAVSLCAIAAGLLGAAGPARADVFGPIQLVSQGTSPQQQQRQQADYAHHPAVSGDGRYVAFDGSFGGVAGVWRRDLAGAAVELVAPGPAVLPSIDQDGRYVSFTTTQKLVPGDENEGPDVYVRDMNVPTSAPCSGEALSDGTCPFELVSAPSGVADEALTYNSAQPASYGSLAAGRAAISADGRYVAFVTTAESNLAGPATPALQVAVRDRQSNRTELVSALIDPASGRPKTRIVGGEEQDEPVPAAEEEGVSYGAAYPGGSFTPSFLGVSRGIATVGASISADGSTVAWIGQQIDRQAPVLAGELSRMKAQYTEPLWRRIQEGPGAPIRRVSGGSDPTSPACAASGETELDRAGPTLLDPCQGPFAIEGEATNGGLLTLRAPDGLPRLSGNGDRVAILVNAREIASGAEFGSSNNFSDDLYVIDMSEGLTRVRALTRLTEIAGAIAGELGRNALISDFDISPDGGEVAFSTIRTVFPLGSPAYISAPAAFPGMVELYEADLSNETLTRVTHGFAGENQPSEAPHGETVSGVDPYLESEGAFSPSFSADGATVAFSSTAPNLVFGDGNAPVAHSPTGYDGSDAFLVSKVPFTSSPVEAQISSAPANPALAPQWRLGVTASSRRDGSVLLRVQVPGRGALSVAARSSVVVSSAHFTATGPGSAHHRRATRTVAIRTVAARTAHPGAGGLVTIALSLTHQFRALATGRGGLSANVKLSFSAAGHVALHQRIQVRFVKARPRALKSAHRPVGGHAAGSAQAR